MHPQQRIFGKYRTRRKLLAGSGKCLGKSSRPQFQRIRQIFQAAIDAMEHGKGTPARLRQGRNSARKRWGIRRSHLSCLLSLENARTNLADHPSSLALLAAQFRQLLRRPFENGPQNLACGGCIARQQQGQAVPPPGVRVCCRAGMLNGGGTFHCLKGSALPPSCATDC